MSFVVIISVAFLASALTFFSGFGLGTLLLPAFALFVPVEHAVAMTAVVHLLNGLFKLVLVGRHADRGVLLRFGIPAVLCALLGAFVLGLLADVEPLYVHELFGTPRAVTAVKLTIGILLALFALVELVPRLADLSFPPRYLPVGGALSGFFGGLSGMQGALRSAFLVRAGLDKRAFVATGAVLACLIDVSRLSLYAPQIAGAALDWPLVGAAVLAAFSGAWLGNRWLQKVTLRVVQRLVGALLFLLSFALISGLI